MTVKVGSGAWIAREAYDEWLASVQQDHDGCIVLPTCDGCDVWKDGKFVIAYTFTEEKGR